MSGQPTVKMAFSFDDPKLLDNYPFVCKIFAETKSHHKYFVIANGKADEIGNLKNGEKFFQKLNYLHRRSFYRKNFLIKKSIFL